MTAILALDTATGPCSVAVWDGTRIAAYLEEPGPVMQSARLMPMVEQALRDTGLTYLQLGTVAATVGPGSFTGIRVGLAAARAIAFAAGIESRGFTTLQVLASAAGGQGDVLAVLNAGKGECYWQRFNGLTPLTPPAVSAPDTILAAASGNHMTGNIAIGGIAPDRLTFPRADALARLAANSSDFLPLRPFYIRAPDAKLPGSAA